MDNSTQQSRSVRDVGYQNGNNNRFDRSSDDAWNNGNGDRNAINASISTNRAEC